MSIDPKGGKMGERTHHAPSKEYTHEHGKINYDDKISVPNTSHDLKNSEQMEKTSAHPSRFSPCISHDLKNSEKTEKMIAHPSRASPCTSHDLKNSEQMEKTSAHPSRFSPCISHDLKNSEKTEKMIAHPSRASPCTSHDLKNSEQMEKTSAHPSRFSPCISHDLKNSEKTEKMIAHPSRASPCTSHDLKNSEQMEKTSAHPSRFSPCISHDLKNSEQTEKTIAHPSRASPCTSHDLKNSEQMEKTSAHPSRFSPCISHDLKNSEQTEKTIAHPSRASPCTSHDLKNSEQMEMTSAHPSRVSPCTSHDLKNSEKTEKTSAHPSRVSPSHDLKNSEQTEKTSAHPSRASPCTSHDLKNLEKTEKTSAHPSRVSPSHDLKNSEQTEKTSAHPSRASPCETIKVHPNSQVKPSSTYKPHNEYKKPEGGVNPCPLPSPKRHTNTDNPFSMASNQSSQMSPSSKTSSTTSSFSQGWSTRSSNRSDSIDSTGAPLRPHTGGDVRWDAITSSSKESPLNLTNFRLLKRLGYGDIGSVYLVQLRGTNAFFAMKVMDKGSLASRNKLLRAQTEREILGLLDHPFLPTLYTYFETDKFYCLVMEFCSGGNLHTLRQKQPNKYFTEEAARFYASEVLLALEYLHMLGIVYRDLKPENVLVREEGHIMLSDFDLSLRCSVCPTLVKSSSGHDANTSDTSSGGLLKDENMVRGCMQPSSFFPRLLPKKNRKSKSDFGLGNSVNSLPELMAEPTNVRSMSFVGTHEYLAPEIIRGEGHGSAVDWWTFGIFLYELLHGITPFKGNGNRATLFNVVGQPLKFPESPQVSATARELIKGLLVKEPQKRIAYKRGATEIKQHPFFEGVNWALVRSVPPPYVPDPVDFTQFATKESGHTDKKITDIAQDKNNTTSAHSSYVEFEYF